MHKFAHLADCHLGAFRDRTLRELNLGAFLKALDKCIEEKVDFIVVSGDLFHSNIPDMHIVDRAVSKIRALKDKGIPVYLIYGSHDYSTTEASIIDILNSAGLFQKVAVVKKIGGKIELEFFVDKKTGAKIVGMSARKLGLEKNFYKKLNWEALESEDGFKIFAFHTAIADFLPVGLSQISSVPLMYFPRKFDYYAAGHVHYRLEKEMKEYGTIVFPGPVFAADYTDLESLATKPSGFYMVEFDQKIKSKTFVPVNVCEVKSIHYDATGKNSSKANEELAALLEKEDFGKKLVLLKIFGELAGKTSDIEFAKFRDKISEKGALVVYINRHGLTTKEQKKLATDTKGKNIEEIEDKLFSEGLKVIETAQLSGENGLAVSKKLLDVLRQEKPDNETSAAYQERIVEGALNVLGAEAKNIEKKYENLTEKTAKETEKKKGAGSLFAYR